MWNMFNNCFQQFFACYFQFLFSIRLHQFCRLCFVIAIFNLQFFFCILLILEKNSREKCLNSDSTIITKNNLKQCKVVWRIANWFAMQTILPSSSISLQLSKLEGYTGICQCFSGASLLCKFFVILLVLICGSLFFCASFL